MSKQAVAVIFGGRSVEHEVSVITAHQVMAGLATDRYRVVPVYIAKNGVWYTGDCLNDLARYRDVAQVLKDATAVVPAADVENAGVLWRQGARQGGLLRRGDTAVVDRFDIAFPVIHGSHGEDGTIQGIFELSDTPYVGCGVTAAALGMDKPLSRAVFRSAGLPVLDDLIVHRADPAATNDVKFPAYVKPATLGSSIGVSRVTNAEELRDALAVAFAYDDRAVIETAQDDIVEINCSVLGLGRDIRASVCEQPNKTGLLSYSDKYARGVKGGTKHGAKSHSSMEQSKSHGKGMAASDRTIPAPISDELTSRIQAAATTAFVAIGAAGVARIDFLVRPDDEWFVVNEINTLPGSLSHYLWEPSGVPFPKLLDTLIDQGTTRATSKRASTYSMDDWLLRGAAEGA